MPREADFEHPQLVTASHNSSVPLHGGYASLSSSLYMGTYSASYFREEVVK
jgi:hypothetical protein